MITSDYNVVITANAVTTTFSGAGEGTKASPYQISSAEQLNEIRNNLTACYELTSDIDISAYSNWQPIGDDENYFEGQLDGKGFIIKGLTINRSTTDPNDNIGLFGICHENAKIKNLNLSNVSINVDVTFFPENEWISKGGIAVGAIAGSAENVDNCSVNGSISAYYNGISRITVGGIIGYGRNPHNCTNYADIIVNSNTDVNCGGIVGFPNAVYGKVINCTNYGNVSAVAGNYLDCGGICGEDGAISHCVNYGTVTGRVTNASGYSSFAGHSNIGGIVGASSGEVKYSINYGSISSSSTQTSGGYTANSSYAGGIAGWSGYYSSGLIENCVNCGGSISSWLYEDYDNHNDSYPGSKARIANGYTINNCYSLSSTDLEDLVLTPDDIGAETNHGDNKTQDEIDSIISEFPNSTARISGGSVNAVVGKKTTFSFTYTAKNPANIDDELANLSYSYDDWYALNVENQTYLKNSDNKSALVTVDLTANKCGVYEITPSVWDVEYEAEPIIVTSEPELILPGSSKGDYYNNYSDVTVLFPKTRKDQTKEVKLTVAMDNADKDYLEKFLKSIEIEREENGDLILGRSNYKTSYTISDDGKSAEYTISITSPDIEIKDYLVIKTKAQSKKIRVLRDSTTQDSQLDYTAADYYIIGEVEKYCSDTGNMAIVDEIINSQYSSDAKQEMLLNYFVNKGFNTTLEGSKYISECTTYSRNYNYLINNYNYCSYIYSEDIEKNPSKKLALINGKLIFGNELLEPFNYSPELINHNPTAKKYKEMLRSFICANSTENEVMKSSATLGEVLNNILEIYKESDDANYNKILTEAQNNMDKLLKGSISENDVYNNMASNISKDVNNGDAKLKIPAISKALGYASTTVSFASATSNDVLALMNLEKDVRLYQDNMYFLQTIVDSPYASYDMQLAAESLLDDIENGYTKLVNDILVNLFKYTKDSVEIMIDFNQWEYFLGSEVSNALLTYKIAVVISNSIVDTGDFIKQTCFTKGYAELADLFQKKLQDDKAEFKINESKDNAWTFFKDYTILWCLRYEGEKQYLEAGKLKYFIVFEGRVANFSDRQSAVEANLSTLEEAKFYIDSNIEMSNIQYMKKAVIHCPVDVYVYNPDGTLIVKLKDEIESDITNEYGRFGVVYNPYTDEYDKVIALLNDAGINIKIVSIDDGLVNFNMIKKDANDDLHNLSFDNLVIYKNDIVSLNINNNEYLVDRNGDNKIDETAQLIVNDDYIKVDEISFKAGKVSLNVGESSVVNVNVSPLNASYKALNWTSNDKSIAKVENGKITALSAGTTKIHVFALDNPEAKLEIMVNVLPYGDTATFVGDVNGDGKINVTDVSKTAAHVKGIRPLDEKEQKCADVNGDNKINVTDVSKIAAHVKGIRALQKNNDNQNDTSNSDPKDNSETENGKNDPNEINNGEYAEILYDKECGRWYVEDDDGNALPLTCTYDPDKEIWYTSNGKELNVVHSDNVKNPNYELPDKVAYLVLPNGEAMQLSNSGYLNTIYNEIDGHKVSAIGYRFNTPWVYGGNYGLIDPNNNDSGIKMTIPDNITYCGSASMLTWGLNELQLSDSLLCIEDSAFMVYDGTSLNDTTFNDLKLNNGLKYIGDKAFFGYSALTSVNIPSSVNHIGDYALGYYTDIEKLQEYYQEHIGDEDYELKSPEKFYKKIEDFTIYGKKGTEAERYAKANGFIFIDNNEVLPDLISLNETSLTLDEGSSAQLTATILPINATDKSVTWFSSDDSVATVNDGLITGVSAGSATITAKSSNGLTALCLVDVNIGATQIGDNVFYRKEGNTVRIFGDGNMWDWEDIGENISPFYCDNSLQKVIIEEGITRIGSCSFFKCSNLREISCPNSLKSIGAFSFDSCSFKNFSIPNNVNKIGGWAFNNCANLTKIDIPRSVSYLDSDAFSLCSSLTSIYIPNTITTFESGVFLGCSNLSNVTIEEGVSEIPEYTFAKCDNLKEISIPKSVNKIGSFAFGECYSLKYIYIYGFSTIIEDHAFSECPSSLIIYCVAHSKAEEYAIANSILSGRL